MQTNYEYSNLVLLAKQYETRGDVKNAANTYLKAVNYALHVMMLPIDDQAYVQSALMNRQRLFRKIRELN